MQFLFLLCTLFTGLSLVTAADDHVPDEAMRFAHTYKLFITARCIGDECDIEDMPVRVTFWKGNETLITNERDFEDGKGESALHGSSVQLARIDFDYPTVDFATGELKPREFRVDDNDTGRQYTCFVTIDAKISAPANISEVFEYGRVRESEPVVLQSGVLVDCDDTTVS